MGGDHASCQSSRATAEVTCPFPLSFQDTYSDF